MSETLSFPGLGWEFELHPVLVQITDTWAIKWYGVIVTLGFVLGCLYVLRRARKFGLDPDRVLDVLLGAVVGGVIGARIYYVAFSWDTYQDNLWRVFQIWTGGIAIYGGIIGGLIVGVLVCRMRKVKVLPMIDLAAAGLLLGQAVGRWGNFINMEAFGANTTAPWGMTSPTIAWYLQYNQARLAELGVIVDPLAPVHPTFFYESVWCLIGFLLLVWLTNRRRFDGELSLAYLGWYGVGRFWIEGLRTDSLMFGPVRVSQALALVCVLTSVALLLYVRAKLRRSGNPDYLMLYADTPEGKRIAAGASFEAAAEPPANAQQAVQIPKFRRPRTLRGAKKLAAARLARKNPKRMTRGG